MEGISTMKRAEVLKQLQTHKKYNLKTQKQIVDKLGGIDNMRKELLKLNKSVDDTPIKPSVDDTAKTEYFSFLPKEITLDILSSLNISQTLEWCKTNKHACNNDFWVKKLKSLDLPLSKKKIDYFKLLKFCHLRVTQLLKILIRYHFHKGQTFGGGPNHIGLVIYSTLPNSHPLVRNYPKLKHSLTFTKNRVFDEELVEWVNIPDLKTWTLYETTLIITEDDLIDILIYYLYPYYIHYYKKISDRSITDLLSNNIVYEDLIRKATSNNPISKAYLAMYELLMEK